MSYRTKRELTYLVGDGSTDQIKIPAGTLLLELTPEKMDAEDLRWFERFKRREKAKDPNREALAFRFPLPAGPIRWAWIGDGVEFAGRQLRKIRRVDSAR